jgi:hypothetical protein
MKYFEKKRTNKLLFACAIKTSLKSHETIVYDENFKAHFSKNFSKSIFNVGLPISTQTNGIYLYKKLTLSII